MLMSLAHSIKCNQGIIFYQAEMLRPFASWEILCARGLTLSAELCPTILWLNYSMQRIAATVITMLL